MSKTVIYTINEKEYNEAMRILHNLGYKWRDGNSCSPEEWKPAGGVDRLIYLILNKDDKLLTFNKNTMDPDGGYDDPISLKEFMIQHPLSFTKEDLEDGMIIELGDGRYYMYFKKFNAGVRYEGYISIGEYNDDLTYNGPSSLSSYDIVAVYKPEDLITLDFASQVEYLNLIWKRPEKIRMTIKEIEEKLGIKNLEIIEEKEKFDE